MFSDQIMTFLTIDLIYVALSVLKKEDVHVGEYFDIESLFEKYFI